MIHELIEKRRSPRAYSTQALTNVQIESLFEAARWSPSGMNEQPWRYIYATSEQPDHYATLLECLVESNQVWAKNAPLLILSMAKMTDGEGNARNGIYETGLANAQLTLQATSMDLYVHQMGGFSPAKACEVYQIPENFQPVVIMAVGYLGELSVLSEKLQAREVASRTRKSLTEITSNEGFVFE